MPEITQNGFNDVLVGGEFFHALDVTDADLVSPVNQKKVNEIAQFLNEHPDPLFVISMVRNNRSPHMSNLDFLAGYVQLEKRRGDLQNQLDYVKNEISYYTG